MSGANNDLLAAAKDLVYALKRAQADGEKIQSPYIDDLRIALAASVEQIVVPRALWERTVGVIKTIRNSRKGSCGSIENVYCPGTMNRHGIDSLWNDIQGHNV